MNVNFITVLVLASVRQARTETLICSFYVRETCCKIRHAKTLNPPDKLFCVTAIYISVSAVREWKQKAIHEQLCNPELEVRILDIYFSVSCKGMETEGST
jgi:hypothetical protein